MAAIPGNHQQQTSHADYYPDFLKENQEMTDQVNFVIAESGSGAHKRSRAAYGGVYNNSMQHSEVRGAVYAKNEKENNAAALLHQKHRKISARRMPENQRSPQPSHKALDSVQVKLSPPHQLHQYRKGNNKLSQRKESNHHVRSNN